MTPTVDIERLVRDLIDALNEALPSGHRVVQRTKHIITISDGVATSGQASREFKFHRRNPLARTSVEDVVLSLLITAREYLRQRELAWANGLQANISPYFRWDDQVLTVMAANHFGESIALFHVTV